MKKIIYDSRWRKYWIILLLIFIIGLIGFISPFGDEHWNFLFENMIWLPVELILTIFAVNKVLKLIEEDKNKKRFILMTRRANKHLIYTIKKNVVSIPINCQIHDESRDENKLYYEIIENPNKFFNDELFSSTRLYYFVNYQKNYNYMGIRLVHCMQIDEEIKKYINRYEMFLDDNLFSQLNIVEQENSNFGVLQFPSDAGRLNNLSYQETEISGFKRSAQNYLNEINKLIVLLESYNE